MRQCGSRAGFLGHGSGSLLRYHPLWDEEGRLTGQAARGGFLLHPSLELVTRCVTCQAGSLHLLPNIQKLLLFRELIQGICVKDRNQNELGHSRRAAAVGITQVVISRITMAAPGMILLPVVMERLERLHLMKKLKVLHAPLQVLLCGCFLLFMVPVACGLFPQECELPVSYLEPELQNTIKAKYGEQVLFAYFNKGL